MDARVGIARTLQPGSGKGEGGTSHFGGAELLGQFIILPSHVLLWVDNPQARSE